MELGSCLWLNKGEESGKTKEKTLLSKSEWKQRMEEFWGRSWHYTVNPETPHKNMSGKKPLLWQYINYTIYSCSKKDRHPKIKNLFSLADVAQ